MTAFEIHTVIISLLGAVATFSAVVVALWQTKYANRKKLKCKFSDKCSVYNPSNNAFKEYVYMSVTNIGNKIITINLWGILTTKTEGFALFTALSGDPIDKQLSVKTPYRLDPEENINFYFDRQDFASQIKHEIEEKRINKNKKLRLFVSDSTGKKYIVKSLKSALEYTK